VFWGIFLVTLFGLSTQWRALYFPYRFFNDLQDQLRQINSESYSDIHAIGHTIFLRALLSCYNNPGFVVFVQLLMIAFLNGVFAWHLCRRGVPYTALLILTDEPLWSAPGLPPLPGELGFVLLESRNQGGSPAFRHLEGNWYWPRRPLGC
jgi:hypothetical protein